MAANRMAVRPAMSRLPPAIATTSSTPSPLFSPPLAWISRVMAAMSINTCRAVWALKDRLRQSMVKMLRTLKARYARLTVKYRRG